jgi:hypothetical protein
VSAEGRNFIGGNFPIGQGRTCTATNGSSSVTVGSEIFFDGILGWTIKFTDDTSGGFDGRGSYFANFVSSTEIQLIDANGDATNYEGSTGSDKEFSLFLPGNVLRWCKDGEPESYPTSNTYTFEGNVTGLAQLPNLPILMVCTDTPKIFIFDLTLLGTVDFKTKKRLISTEYSATSHYSLVGVGRGRLRGIDATRKCIFESDGVSVEDITKFSVPKIFDYLDDNETKIENWHCAYDPVQYLFGAFVSFRNSHRTIDFCIGQNTKTGGWFFNYEKDLLCTGEYIDPDTGVRMVLGGTEGLTSAGISIGGAVWGRIWAPGTYDEWVPANTLRSGTITSATSTSITVDNSSDDLYNTGGGLSGRWVLVCDENGESSQLAYIASNTADTITIDSVINSVDPFNFSPTPSSGWKFYVGLIEARWGPKRFEFDDPDLSKNVDEVRVVMSDYNESDLPFMRFYRGLELGYAGQNPFIEGTYRDGSTSNQDLYSRYESHGEETPRWGVSVIDRSYDRTALRSVSIVFKAIGPNRATQ